MSDGACLMNVWISASKTERLSRQPGDAVRSFPLDYQVKAHDLTNRKPCCSRLIIKLALGEPLEQVITLRGPFMANRTDDEG